MKKFYIHIVVEETVIITTLPTDLREEVNVCKEGFSRVFCPVFKKYKRYKKEIVDNGFIYMCSYDETITNKIFTYYFDAVKSLYGAFMSKINSINDEQIKYVRRLQHNINTYNAMIQDEIYNLIPMDDRVLDDWWDIVRYTTNIVRDDIQKSSIVLLKIMKYNSLITAEMTVYDYINGNKIKLNIYPHLIHKIIKLSLQPYYLEFIEKKVRINMDSCYDKVLIDYPSMSVALGHIWSNAIKYIYENTPINIKFYNVADKTLCIKISMLSLKIEDNEIYNIYSEGYSGKWAKILQKEGNGIGMYYIKILTELNKGRFFINSGSKLLDFGGVPYANNVFIFELPLATD